MTQALEVPMGVELSRQERLALDSWSSGTAPALSPSLVAQLFELYLNGSSCDEIARLNPGVPLGAIVAARLYHRWDERKEQHINHLLDTVRERVQQVQMEAVHFVSDQLAAAHKLQGDKIKRFLQTGDPNELGDFAPDTLEKYRKSIELLLKLTGQDGNKKVAGEVKHTHTLSPVPAEGREVTSDKAARILEILVEDEG
jgi:hypothetical protein